MAFSSRGRRREKGRKEGLSEREREKHTESKQGKIEKAIGVSTAVAGSLQCACADDKEK